MPKKHMTACLFKDALRCTRPYDNEYLLQTVVLHMSLFTSQSLETPLLYRVRSDGTPLLTAYKLQSNGHHTPTTLQRHC
ncbi:uncharacterized protein LACBIDRAFT_299439 [Laccaria bicolor S238N-H82]|uniref:Predicted protein n=1 Tax=Laccaria bicolor (strain S238N-H82 / ATCC MYA-4686) TaxID=486041 RepID=B0DEQ2_LACBS|nr:uncharacterized protein LACBIDRAFT_299439 [Laccaria bicolor S238N-H82]EDR06979.1 predicted protein [Laccaria bicolor S238N-H82]|eukprot:XP_001882352.1 predicted protein [Laccaria bicolor S238N-H82]